MTADVSVQPSDGSRAAEINLIPKTQVDEKQRLHLCGEFNENPEWCEFDPLARLAFYAAASPHAPALRFAQRELSYSALDVASSRLAYRLHADGLQKGDRVGVYMQRGLECLIAFYALLKLRAVYVPLDPAYPRSRVDGICRDACVGHLLMRTGQPVDIDTSDMHCVEFSEESLGAEDGAWSPRSPEVISEYDSAYAIYTSGSTGRPKGVLIHRKGLSGVVRAQRRLYQISSTDRVVHQSSICFDASIFEFMLALGSGACLVIGGHEEVLPGTALTAFLARHTATVMFVTPTALSLLAPGDIPSVRVLIAGGEELKPPLAIAWRSTCQLYNIYGPTETSVFATSFDCTNNTFKGRVPIGQAVPGATLHILDENFNSVPEGQPGELCIGGDGVGIGYINRPDLNADRFIELQTRNGSIGERVYRSGDIVIRQADGNLVFLGRNDEQVKIRGFRIELGEIDCVIAEHPAVRQVATVALERADGDRRLTTYFVPHWGGILNENATCVGEQLSQGGVVGWESLYDEKANEHCDSESIGVVPWSVRYAAEPVRQTEIAEWLNRTLRLIRRFVPKKVLEVDCGVGKLLEALAPECVLYVGTDIGSVVERFQNILRTRAAFAHVRLRDASATNLKDRMQGQSYDTVIWTSCAHTGSDVRYVQSLLEQAVGLVESGGRILITDIRNLALLEVFHTTQQIRRANGDETIGELKARIEKAIDAEAELAIAPEYFWNLPQIIPGISHVDIELKRGLGESEVTRYRYDAVLYVGHPDAKPVSCPSLHWRSSGLSFGDLEEALVERRWAAITLCGIPNGRLECDSRAHEFLESLREDQRVSTLRERLLEPAPEFPDPELICSLAEECGYEASLTWGERPDMEFDVRLIDRSRHVGARLSQSRAHDTPRPLEECTNHPLGSRAVRTLVPPLQRHLRSRVPEYMVPTEWIALDRLPLMISGKVDKRALPQPRRISLCSEGSQPSGTSEGSRLSAVFADVLGLESVGVHDDFFELGGHSISAARVIARLRDGFGMDIDLRTLFETRTAARLSEQLELLKGPQQAMPALLPDLAGSEAPLTFGQERLWFLDQLGVGAAYNVLFALRLQGSVDARVLERSLVEIVRRHEPLRTRFALGAGGAPVQVRESANLFRLELKDVAGLSSSRRKSALDELMHAEQLHRFDLAAGNLFRACLVRLGPQEYALLLTVHHIAVDGWSVGLMVKELGALYGAYLRGLSSPLEKLPVSYSDYAVWERKLLGSSRFEQELKYWVERLDGAPAELRLPTDRRRPPVASYRGAAVNFELSGPLSRALRELAQRSGATLFMVCLAAFQTLLARYTGQLDIVVGTPISGRHQKDTESLIGFFINMLALRTDLSGSPSFRELLSRVRETTLGAYAHQQFPFGKLVTHLYPNRDLSRQPVFQVMLALQNFPQESLNLPGMVCTRIGAEHQTAQFDLSLQLFELPNGIMGQFEYATDLFDRATLLRMTQHFRGLLENVTRDPDASAL